MSEPLVSIVVPAYNSAATIEEAIASVQAQTCTNWELLVIDDASTDAAVETVRRLTGRQAAEGAGESQIRLLVRNQNGGPAAARNDGLAAAKGDYIAFLDADDVWLPKKLELQLRLFEKQPQAAICYTGYRRMDLQGHPFGKPYLVPDTTTYNHMLRENVIGLSTVLLNRVKVNEYPETLSFDATYAHEDYQLWLRLLRAGIPAVGIPEVQVHHRTGGRNEKKWRAAKNRWDVYRRSEGMSFASAVGCLAGYFCSAASKYY